MMVCSKAMINIARKMEERYGIPYFEGSFYGISDMSESLRQIASLLVQRGAPANLVMRTEAVIAREEARAWSRIAKYRERLQGRKVLLITGGVKSWSVVAALQEAGMEVVGTSVKKSTKEDIERIKELMGTDAHMIDDLTPRENYKMLRDARADIMLSGGRSQFIALKAKMPWLDINQERHHAYAGYEGMVALVHEIDKTLSNPIWKQVRVPAPWDEVTWEATADAAIAAEEASLVADPQSVRERERQRQLCNCTGLSVGSVEDLIQEERLTRVDEVTVRCGAAGGCGGCGERVAALLARTATSFDDAPLVRAA
jgi:nitrogenase molybdenum-cofactor synthesis protein NifE